MKRIKRFTKPGSNILDRGKIEDLNYEVFGRGTIHIFNDGCKKFLFKKDCSEFLKNLKEHNFNALKENQTIIIQGSGDNDN